MSRIHAYGSSTSPVGRRQVWSRRAAVGVAAGVAAGLEGLLLGVSDV